MTKAKYFAELADYIELDHGFKDDYQWSVIVNAAREAAIKIDSESPWATGAHDASELLTFPDGSQLEINNPRQHDFAGFCRIVR